MCRSCPRAVERPCAGLRSFLESRHTSTRLICDGLVCRKSQDELVQEEHPAFGRHQRTVMFKQETVVEERGDTVRFDPRGRDALEDPQPQEDLFEVGIRWLQALLAADRQLTRLDAGHVLLRGADVPPAMVLTVGMRAGAETNVGPPFPIA